jgi:hypothetical protein
MNKMKTMLSKLFTDFRSLWLRRPAFHWLVCLAAPALFLCLLLGGWRWAMLGIGYMQLVFAAFLPGEMVETSPLQRAAVFCSGMTRMLFFTGMTAHAAWPFRLMGGTLLLCLLTLHRGEREGMEMSPLPLLSAACFTILGLALGVRVPAAPLILSAALALTLVRLLVHQKRTMRELAMRFHWA